MCEKRYHNRIDKCMRKAIETLNRFGIRTLACCCGHGKYPMTIVFQWTRANFPYHGNIYELFSMEQMKRKKKFYKKDNQGIYFIPEVK